MTDDVCDEGRRCAYDPGCPVYEFCIAHAECTEDEPCNGECPALTE